ncbi:TPA: HNH endonuclease [archaeon]|uniref:HNH endonuclease n=1 Tax=Candidatus Naiadarchaeum limnaeum TaxID=2756139 RepID=A0A832UMG0_9ARCH|nr:HNH endonuclease [Candidatus Naiadarchaeales archaeon SRR2090153.bin1042]HIJ99908.1 HNH endonuclease [Candidatus Naiadarchaeum limnaeum]
MARNPFSMSGYDPLGLQPEGDRKRKPISKSLRDQVWLKYFRNKTQGKCYCCRIRPIHFTYFQVGHNKAVSRGGKNHITNLRPICATCNRDMGTRSIEAYRKETFAKPTKRKIPRKKSRKRRAYNPLEIRMNQRNPIWG